jgi:hypothetical protein
MEYIKNGSYRNQESGCGVDSSGLGQGSVTGFFESSNQLLRAINTAACFIS